MEFITLIIITSLFINGLHWATYYELNGIWASKDGMKRNPDESNALWFLRYYPEKWFPSFIHRPLISCVQCMASVWGSLFYWGHFHTITIESVIMWVVFVMCVSAMNMVINKLIEG